MANRKIVPVDQARKEGKPMAANEEKKFDKVIITDKNGEKYTLQFNARVVKTLERRGFKVDTEYPRTTLEDLVIGAFQMHHKGLSAEKILSIWEAQTKKDELIGVITKLYMRPIEDFMAEPEGEDNTPTWETV